MAGGGNENIIAKSSLVYWMKFLQLHKYAVMKVQLIYE